MRTGIEVVGAAFVGREAGRDQAMEGGHQRRGAVDHRRVDDLAPARTLCLENAADQPKS